MNETLNVKEEFVRSLGVLNINFVLYLIIVGIVGFLLYVGSKYLLKFLDTIGIGSKINMGLAKVGLNLFFPLLFLVVVGKAISKKSMILEASVLLFVVVVAIVVLSDFFRNIVPVFGIVFSSDIKEGDWVRIGSVQGKLKSMGIFRFAVEGDEGERISLPLSKVREEGILQQSHGAGYNFKMIYGLNKQKIEMSKLPNIESQIKVSSFISPSSSVSLEYDEQRIFISATLLGSEFQDIAKSKITRLLQTQL